MKVGKILCFLLVMVLILSLATVSVSAATQPKLFIAPQTYTATMLGQAFTIDINISNVQNLAAFNLKLSYNSTLLNNTVALVPPFDKSVRSRWIINMEQGYVTFAVNYSQAGNGNGTLATVTFKAIYAASASCTLHLSNAALYNSNRQNMTYTLQDGSYNFVVPSVNVATDKPTYSRGNNVKISGKLMLGSSPFNGLLALEAVNPNSVPILARTLKLITSPPAENISILNLYPCNYFGNPVTSFSNTNQGVEAYFNVTFINQNNVARNVTIVVTVYDNNGTTLGVGLDVLGAPPGIISVLPTMLIPSWAALGNATVYASLFSKLPSAGGTPYCPESSASFKIIGYGTLGSGAGAPPSGGSPGNYSLTFRLSSNVIGTSNGTYEIYAAFQYQGQAFTNETFFGVNPVYPFCVPNPLYKLVIWLVPWGSGNWTTEAEDTIVTDIRPILPYNATRIYPGWPVSINLTVKNEGTSSEVLLIIAGYCNGTTISQRPTITSLAPLSVTTLSLAWNTAGISPGGHGVNYTMTAVAAVFGKNNTSYNTLTDGTVKVNLIGDVNNAGRVTAIDIGLIGISLFSKPGNPLWNPYCDLTDAGEISAIDLGLAGIYLFT